MKRATQTPGPSAIDLDGAHKHIVRKIAFPRIFCGKSRDMSARGTK